MFVSILPKVVKHLQKHLQELIWSLSLLVWVVALVQGQHHRHIRALGRQLRRPGARHIRKASGFAERNRLAGRI